MSSLYNEYIKNLNLVTNQNSKDYIYFQFINKLKDFFMLCGILYRDDTKILINFLEDFSNQIDEEIQKNKIDSKENIYIENVSTLNLFPFELDLIKTIVLPEIRKYGLDFVIYENHEINLKSLIKYHFGNEILCINKDKFYGSLLFSQIMKETSRIKLHFHYYSSRGTIKIIDNKEKSNLPIINEILNKDKRLYNDINSLIKSYLDGLDTQKTISLNY